MGKLTEFVKRNMKIYLRDRSAVFFSLMTMIIVIGLMLLFLGDMNVEAVTKMLSALPGRDAQADEANAKLLVLMWTCAGIIPINAVTVAISALSPMIKDRAEGRINSIYTAPVSRLTVSAGYICSTCFSAMVICILTLVISEIYCVTQGAEAFSFAAHMKLLGMIAANSFTYSSLVYLLSAAAKTEGAWSSLGTVIGTLVGFIGGIYIPIGTLSDGIAAVLKCTPVIYGTSMFRQIMTADIMEKTFEGAPAEMAAEYSKVMGISLEVFDKDVSIAAGVLIVLGAGVLSLALGALATKYARRTDR